MAGVFITIEGPEGSGKSTQAERLVAFLEGQGLPVTATREPGGTSVGERIRALVLDPAHREMSPATEALLFAASRAQFVAEVVRPALAAGRVVVSQRYVDASLAYQGHARGLGVEVVREVNRLATGDVRPDLTVLLDIPPEVGLGRVRAKAHVDRIEQEDLAFYRKVRDGFLAIARAEPDRVRIVRGDRPVDEVQGEIRERVLELLRARRVVA